MSKESVDINDLFRQLKNPVIIPIPYGQKGPRGKEAVGWNQVTWEKTQELDYKQKIMDAIRRGGNLGILLGPVSGDLVAIDFDDDDDAHRFFKLLPWAKDTMVTKGRHFQVWFYMTHDGYPARRVILKEPKKGKPTVEFRGGGGLQSVVFGQHPDDPNVRYSWNGKLPKHIDYVDLTLWLAELRGQKSLEEKEEEHPGQNLDHAWLKKFAGSDIRNLDLVGLLESQGVKLRKRTDIEWDIPCPWKYNHTTETGARDAEIVQHPPGRFFPAFHCFHAHCSELGLPDLLNLLEISPEEVKKWCKRPGKVVIELPPTKIYNEIFTERPKLPRELIKGLFHAECKGIISAQSKLGKTWAAMDLAISLVYGELWMDFDTCQSRILYANMEMGEPFFDNRLYDMQRVRHLGNPPKDAFNVLHLRGCKSLKESLAPLIKRCRDEGPFDVIILDPLYKLFGKRKENAAEEVAELFADVDELIELAKSSAMMVHHFAKGDAWLKEMGDRASGSGVIYRDPDLFMTLTKLEPPADAEFEPTVEARVDISLRNIPSMAPFGIRRQDYQWKRDPNIDIRKKKKKAYTTEGDVVESATDKYIRFIVEILTDVKKPLINKQIKVAALTRGVPEGSFDRILKKAKELGKVVQSGDFYMIKP